MARQSVNGFGKSVVITVFLPKKKKKDNLEYFSKLGFSAFVISVMMEVPFRRLYKTIKCINNLRFLLEKENPICFG